MKPTHLLRIDAVNFAPFLFDTSDLSSRRGGSLLLLDSGEVIKRWLGEMLSENVVTEWREVVVAASTALFEISSTDAALVRKRMAEKLWEHDVLRHATFTVDVVPVTARFEEDHGTLVTLSRQGRLAGLSLAVPTWNEAAAAAPCALDGLRPAVEPGRVADRLGARVSPSVHARRAYGREQKQAFYRKILDRLEEPTNTRPQGFCTDLHDLAGDPPRECAHLGDKIAVIYLDGNSFGKRIRTTGKTPDAYRKVSSSIAHDREEMFVGLLRRMAADPAGWQNAGKARIETLLWGGDEVIWVVPAWKGWETLRHFYEAAAHWRLPGEKPAEGEASPPPLTHSAGLVFAHMKAPIQRLEALARQLADRAKESTNRRSDAFACEVLESYDHIGAKLEDYYRRRYPCWSGDAGGAGWLDFRGLTLDGGRMKDIQDAMRGLEAGNEFPRRRLHVNSDAVLNSMTLHEAQTAVSADAGLISGLAPLFATMADPTGATTGWLHAAMLWDYVARVPLPSASS